MLAIQGVPQSEGRRKILARWDVNASTVAIPIHKHSDDDDQDSDMSNLCVEEDSDEEDIIDFVFKSVAGLDHINDTI